MTQKYSFIFKIIALCLIGLGLLLWWSAPARAQCGDNPPKSSCITCHTKEYPVVQNGEWHGIHALKDCCTNCHGGNCSAQDKNLAHENLVADPLNDIYINCHSCHPGDYVQRAARFAAILAITPGSSPTATPVPAVTAVEHAMVIQSPSSPASLSPQPWIFILSLAGLAALFLLSLLRLAHHLRLSE